MRLITTAFLLLLSFTSFAQADSILLKKHTANTNKMMLLMQQERYDDAITVLNDLLSVNDASIYYAQKGICYSNLKQKEEAVLNFNIAISMEPSTDLYYYLRGRHYYMAQDMDRSLNDLNAALLLCTNDTMKADICMARGNTRLALKDDKGAITDYRFALTAYPDDIEIMNLLGRALLYNPKLEDLKEADQLSRKVFVKDAGNITAAMNMAYSYLCAGFYIEALHVYDKIIKKERKLSGAYNNRGFCRFQLADYDGAMDDYNTAIKHDSENQLAYKYRADLYLKQNKISKACSDLNLAIQYGYTEQFDNKALELKKQHCP